MGTFTSPADRGAPPPEGYLHEFGTYGSDEEFEALIRPFALGGLDAGEPVVLAYDDRTTELLRRWIPEADGLTYLGGATSYTTPTKALVAWRAIIEAHLSAGAERIRIAGSIPYPGHSRSYVGWDRYEAAIDRGLGDLPVWASCLYDARITPDEVLERARARHRIVIEAPGIRYANQSFRSPRDFSDFVTASPDPLAETAPVLELVDPSAAQARGAVRALGTELIGDDRLDDLIFAVSETVANALIYGTSPVGVRMWVGAGRLVVEVHDEGPGPSDPLVGLLPCGRDEEGGRGLWLAHMLDVDVALFPAGSGFTVRLRAGRGHEAGHPEP